MCTLLDLTLVALLAVSVGTIKASVTVKKCCSEFKMLSGDLRTCVPTDWPRNVSLHRSYYTILPPLDEEWLRFWLPPGVTRQSIGKVELRSSPINLYNFPVNTSSVWDKRRPLDADMLRNRAVFLQETIVRPKPGGGYRLAFYYCIDAALPPQEAFVITWRPSCSLDECATKCCERGQVLASQQGNWECEEGGLSDWDAQNASFAQDIDSEFPQSEPLSCPTLRLGAPEDRAAPWARSAYRVNLFSNWKPCFDFYRSNGTLQEGLFYCEYPRVARGLYWLLRPLSVVSVLLLACSLCSIACDRSMRQKAHGWCLALHASCLLAFNVGQVVYFLAISDTIDARRKIKPAVWKMCRHLALSMYFLLTAAWFWLTALCLNMASGFRLQAALHKRSERKKFLALSAFAWGFPLMLTVTCSFSFTSRGVIHAKSDISWIKPTLMETRVCYTEPVVGTFSVSETGSFSVKSGTALFYYGPAVCLVLCNVVCLALTLKKVQYLTRGNSILRREEQRNRLAAENDCAAGDAEGGDARRRNGGGGRAAVDAKTVKLYIKMLLMTGAIEFVSEVVVWTTTSYSNEYPLGSDDYHFWYRVSGYVTDFFRAACVAWMAAPEGGYLGSVLRRWRGEKSGKLPQPIKKSKKRG